MSRFMPADNTKRNSDLPIFLQTQQKITSLHTCSDVICSVSAGLTAYSALLLQLVNKPCAV